MCLAIPGKILEIHGVDPILRMGRVSFGGIIKEVSLAYVPQATIGQYAIVHAGFAISLLDEKEAEKTFQILAEMGESVEPT